MRSLSLFSGAGGGLLGEKLLGWEHIGYVEYNEYCQKIIAQRIKDGILDEAPIFGDIRTFVSEGYADSYKGMVDVVTAGFPCQPFSVAGNQLGEDDPRNMWPQTIACIRRIQSKYALLENVPGLFANEYIRRIFGDLAKSGFDARWLVLGAGDCGAPHRRKRAWILCTNANSERLSQRQKNARRTGKKRREYKGGSASRGGWWATEPDVGRVANGVANRVDRLKALGNGQVPAVVRAAWKLLID